MICTLAANKDEFTLTLKITIVDAFVELLDSFNKTLKVTG